MGQIRKRGTVYWIRWYVDGKRHEESTRSTKYGDATALLRLREGDAQRGVPVNLKANKLRFDEAAQDVVNDYEANGRKSVDDVRARLRHLLLIFGTRRMSSITTADLREYVTRRQRAEAANATVNRELAVVRRAFVLAIQSGKLQTRPHIPMLREDNVRQGFVDDDRFKVVLRHLPETVRPVAQLGRITGWRLGEVLGLNWRNVDFAKGELRLDAGTTKNGHGRVFPFTPEMRALLQAQREYTEHEARRLGRVIKSVWHREGKPIRDFRGAWRSACAAAGCPGLLFHDLRRSAVRSFEHAGIPRAVAMKLTGHLTESVYRRYAIVSEADLRVAVEKLANSQRH